MKQLKALLLPPVGILFHHRITNMKRLGSLQLPPSCKRFSLSLQDTQQEAAQSFTIFPGWNAYPSQDTDEAAQSIATLSS